ncbi:MAG: OprO/OprP family phosphate-selective porin [Vicinamibacterales bacterium]
MIGQEKMVRDVLAAAVACAMVSMSAASTAAQEPPHDFDPLAIVRPLSEHATDTLAQRADDPGEWGFRWDDHPTLHLGRSARVSFRARVQGDVRGSEAEVGDAEGFDVSRRRIGIEGGIDDVLDFQVEHEIGAETPWRDVFVNYSKFEAVRVQAGKFKLPFSLDENTSSGNLDFVYRSRAATQLAPGRDRGVMVHGRTWQRRLGYEIGLFNHDGDNARTSNAALVYGGRTVAARALVQPRRGSKSRLRDLQVGVALTASAVPEGIAALRGRSALDASFFPAEFWVNGSRRRAGVELRWRPGPWSVKAEYIRVATERRAQSVDNTDLSDLVASGWYVSSTYLVTGEHKTEGGDTPRRPLLRGGYGALEIAARIERLAFGSAANSDMAALSPRADVVRGNADRAITLGVNWYPIRRVKLQANLVTETIAEPEFGPLPDRARFWSGLLRFQVTI